MLMLTPSFNSKIPSIASEVKMLFEKKQFKLSILQRKYDGYLLHQCNVVMQSINAESLEINNTTIL